MCVEKSFFIKGVDRYEESERVGIFERPGFDLVDIVSDQYLDLVPQFWHHWLQLSGG